MVRGLVGFGTESPTSVAAISFGPLAGTEYSQGPKLSEEQRIKIALSMCYYPTTERYTYEPSSTIFGRAGMVVQSCVFAVSEDGEVEAIASHEALSKEPNVVSVFEIAFGPDTDPKAKTSTALYFDVPHQCIQKRSRSAASASSVMSIDGYLSIAANQPFYLTRPYDDDAMALTRGILEHRLQVIKLPMREKELDDAGIFSDSVEMENIRAHISSVDVTELGLRSRFECLLRHWGITFWGRCAERSDPNDVEATVLHVNGNYNPPSNHPKGTGEARSVKVWSSFITMVRSTS